MEQLSNLSALKEVLIVHGPTVTVCSSGYAPAEVVIGTASERVVDDLIVHGSTSECRAHIQRYMDNGISVPALAVIPFGVDLADVVAGLSPSAATAVRTPI